MSRVGLMGGTFDPLHHGHLNLAFEILEKCSLEEIWFIPANISPTRMDTPPTPAHHRLKMLELAIEDIPQFKVCRIELDRPPPSYTLDTIQEILKTEKDCALILATDTLDQLSQWKEPEKIASSLPWLIGLRRDFNKKSLDQFSLSLKNNIEKGLVETRRMDISATEIKQRIVQNQYCAHLLPAKVLDYIYENQLYFNGQ